MLRKFGILLIGLCACCSVSADTQLGLQYHSEGAMEQAYREFLQAARVGDHLAQHNLGAMYIQGDHVSRDLVQAYAWLALAAQDEGYAEQGLDQRVLEAIPEEQHPEAEAAFQALLQRYGDQALLEHMTPEFVGSDVGLVRPKVIRTVAPEYPRRSARQGREGWVDILFTIEKDGTTADHRPLYSSNDAMKEVSLEALRQFQFEPEQVDGQSVPVYGVVTRFIFRMDNAQDGDRNLMVRRYMRRLRAKAEDGAGQDQYVYAYMLSAARSYDPRFEPDDNVNQWYLAAAKQDFHPAGFFLGRNLLYGNECRADSQLSHQWLLRSAINGVEESQYMLAMELLSGARFEKDERKALYWLERASDKLAAAQLRLAWLLSTHPDPDIRNGSEADQLWQRVDESVYDRQRYYQVAAAVAAENGDFEGAVNWQNKAVADAKALDLSTDVLQSRLAAYQAAEPWRELP